MRCVGAGGGDADGTEYASAVSQASFRAVAVAANDVAAVFQRDAPELSSLFLVWALQETQRYAKCRPGHDWISPGPVAWAVLIVLHSQTA